MAVRIDSFHVENGADKYGLRFGDVIISLDRHSHVESQEDIQWACQAHAQRGESRLTGKFLRNAKEFPLSVPFSIHFVIGARVSQCFRKEEEKRQIEEGLLAGILNVAVTAALSLDIPTKSAGVVSSAFSDQTLAEAPELAKRYIQEKSLDALQLAEFLVKLEAYKKEALAVIGCRIEHIPQPTGKLLPVISGTAVSAATE